jgi:hypothetical protein
VTRRRDAYRLVIALGCFAIGGTLAYWAGQELVGIRSFELATVVVSIVVGWLAGLAFVGGSVAFESVVERRLRRRGVFEWLTTTMLALFFVGLLGFFATFGPNQLGFVLAKDVGVALAAVLLTLGAILASGGVCWLLLRSLGLVWPSLREEAEQWLPPRTVRLNFAIACLSACLLGLGFSVIGAVAGAAIGERLVLLTFVLVGWFSGSALGWRAANLTSDRYIPTTEETLVARRRHRLRHVAHGGAFAAVALVISAFWSAGSAANSAEAQLVPRSGSSPVVVPATMSAARLAGRFQPVLHFDDREHWYPTSVNWFLAHSRLISNGQPAWCKGANGCRALPCVSVGCCDDREGSCVPSGLAEPTIYWRTASENVLPPRSHRNKHVRIIQYWFFYNFDSLTSLSHNLFAQWHQSDWEQVTVGLITRASGLTPAFVGFSEHCTGTSLPWNHVSTLAGTHPIVYVALGSHANYPQEVRAPIRQLSCSLGSSPSAWLGAGALFFDSALHGSDLEVPFDYALGVRDRTGAKTQPRFALTPLPSTSVQQFHGRWGRDNNLVVKGSSPSRSGSPQSPPCQANDYDVVDVVYCGGVLRPPYSFCHGRRASPCG